MSPPRVTVFIPAYNREGYIRPAVASVLAQTFRDLECLVVDDGSNDRTCAVAESFGDPRVRVVRNTMNLGIPKTRNRGIDLARGQFVALLDSDDVALPDRIATQVDFLAANSEVAAVGSWARAIDEAGRVQERLHTCPDSTSALAFTLMFRCAPRQSTLMIRRDVLARYRYDERCHVSQDLDLFGRLARDLPLRAIQRELVLFRHHPGRITAQGSPARDNIRRQIFHDRLSELGLSPTQGEMDRHMLLAAPRSTLLDAIDDDYVEWAAHWLGELIARTHAARSGAPDPRVDDVATSIWLQVLKCAHRGLGARSVSRTLGWRMSRPIRWKLRWMVVKSPGKAGSQTGKRRGTRSGSTSDTTNPNR